MCCFSRGLAAVHVKPCGVAYLPKSPNLKKEHVGFQAASLSPPWEAALGKDNVDARRSMATNRKLAEEWSRKCSIHLHAAQQKIDEKTVRAHRKSTCQQAGICVCARGNPRKGPRSWQLSLRLCRRLKELCPKVDKRSSPRRILLEQRRLVLAFMGMHDAEIFLHIGYINLSTWHFAGQVLHRAPDLDGCSPFARRGVQLRVQAPDLCRPMLDVLSDLEFIQSFMDLEQPWTAQLYEISNCDGDWLSHQQFPDVLPALALSDAGTFTLWRGGDEEQPQRPRANRNDGSSGRRGVAPVAARQA